MVQRQTPLPGADFYSKESWSRNAYIPQPENECVPAPAPTPILNAPVLNPLPQTIENTLKGCGLSIKAYALIIRTESGEDKVYSSPSLASVRERIFTDAFKSNFRKQVKRATATLVDHRFSHSAFNLDAGFDDFETDMGNGRPNRKHSGGESSSDAKKRKFHGYRSRDDCNDNAPIPILKRTQQLRVGDSAEVERFYTTRFKDMQQGSCKIMGKAFVKLVEPKKQTHHPYTKGAEMKPPWWPNTEGDHRVRHTEPDHLLKPERIRLLVHILRMLTENEKNQHPTVKKLELNVQKLEDVTKEALSNWFNDKEHPKNAAKRPFLKEIFKIAKAEERFKRGEIDADTTFSVMYGERPNMDEESEDEGKDDEDDDDIHTPAASAIASPGSMISPTTMHPQPQMLDAKRLPMRQAQSEDRSQYADNSYYASRGVNFNSQITNGQDLRSFVPTTSYPSPQQNIYSNGWGIMGNGSSVGQSFYVTSPTHSLPTSGTWLPPITQQHVLPLPAVQSQSFQDSLPRYDTAPALGNSLRTGSIGHPHQHNHMGNSFENYMQDNGGYQHHGHGMKVEQNQHLHTQ